MRHPSSFGTLGTTPASSRTPRSHAGPDGDPGDIRIWPAQDSGSPFPERNGMDNWLGPLAFGIAFAAFALVLYWIRFRMERKDDDRARPKRRTDHDHQ